MKQITKNQSGFGAVEVVLIVVIVALIGSVGWLVYKNHHKNAAASTTSSISTKPTTSTKPATPQISSASTNKVVKYATWSSTPNDIQQAVLVAWNEVSPGYKTQPISSCNTDTPSQSVTASTPIYTENNSFVVTGAGCDGGSMNLIVKVNGEWQDIAHTQTDFNCSDLTKYNVPTDLIVAAMQITATDGHVQCVQPDNSVKNLS